MHKGSLTPQKIINKIYSLHTYMHTYLQFLVECKKESRWNGASTLAWTNCICEKKLELIRLRVISVPSIALNANT
jgi:hypothetical protein